VAVARGAGEFAKPVAIKRILPSLAAEPSFIAMFFEEARLAASLDHPHIAKVIDFGESDGLPYIVMEFVHGIDLRGLLSAVRGPLPLPEALTIVVQLAEALQHVHEHRDPSTGKPLGLVHRDVSPSNVLLGYSGGVKLTDFGIVKPTEVTEYTATGALKGKLPYLSPEQGRCERLDRRTDVYAMGLVLWELTVGRRMHRAESEVGLLARVCDGVYTAPSSIMTDYDAGLEAIVAKALAPDIAERYATAREVAADLERLAVERGWTLSSARLSEFIAAHVTDPSPVLLQPLADDERTVATPERTRSTTRRSPRRARQLAFASALLAVGIGVGVTVGPTLVRSDTEPTTTRPREEAPPAREATRAPEPATRPAMIEKAASVSTPTDATQPEAQPSAHAAEGTSRARVKKRRRSTAKRTDAPRLNKTLLPPSQQ
jgi:eukaryotic-like serine/threonine-protein kinase